VSARLQDAVLPGIRAITGEAVELRHRIHANPELGYEEFVTSDIVAGELARYGYEVHRGLAGTGVVGTLRAGTSDRRIGLRADMDALPIEEQTGLAYESKIKGKMHACGHDGHTATLLAAARHLAQTREFDGTLHLIFQPAEESLGGARRMVEDGLFKLFPCDAVFAFHNMPGFPTRKFGFRPGTFMASSDTVVIKVFGRGGHGSVPHLSIDPVVASAHIILALQTVVSRHIDPRDMAVVTVGAIHAGAAANVIPDSVEMRLSVRAFKPATREFLRTRIVEVVETQARTLGTRAEIEYQWRYPPLVNDLHSTAFAESVARDWLGDEGIIPDLEALPGSEDFAFMLQHCPGCYFIVGNGDGPGGCITHHPGYDLNDACLPLAASYWVKLVQRFLSPQGPQMHGIPPR
jgi:hippurate hydrolase